MDKRFFRPLGFLAIFAATPMIDAGLQALPPFIQAGDWLRVALCAIGTLNSLLFLLAGILLCARLPVGGRIAYWSTVIAIPSGIIAAVIRMVGAHALLYGVCYPIAIVMLLNRATPADPNSGDTEDARRTLQRPNDGLLRSASL
jgi:hypothetical protein